MTTIVSTVKRLLRLLKQTILIDFHGRNTDKLFLRSNESKKTLSTMAIDVETTTEESSIQSNRRRRRRRRLASKQPPGFFGTVLEALHPQAFLKAFRHVDDSDTTVFEENEPMPPELVQQVIFEASQQEANINIDVDRLDNLSELQRLVDDHHTYNRVPIVCTSKWDIFPALAHYILYPCNPDERRQACRIMNDLSIPYDNKAIMLLGPQRNVILTALLQIIRDGLEETYVCCACLLNLSKLQDGRLALISFEPPNSHITNNDLLRNPHSLLQTIEFSLSRYSELYSHTTVHAKTTTTVQGLAVHHIVGMLLHLTNDLPEVALLVCQTQIPKLIAFLISKSNKPLCKWTSGCLEDLSLALLVHVTSDPNCTKTLLLSSDRIGSSLERLSQQKGIHGLRAATIICQLSSCESM